MMDPSSITWADVPATVAAGAGLAALYQLRTLSTQLEKLFTKTDALAERATKIETRCETRHTHTPTP